MNVDHCDFYVQQWDSPSRSHSFIYRRRNGCRCRITHFSRARRTLESISATQTFRPRFRLFSESAGFAIVLDWRGGFYGHRLHQYRNTQPHAGFDIINGYRKPLAAMTSNVDGPSCSRFSAYLGNPWTHREFQCSTPLRRVVER